MSKNQTPNDQTLSWSVSTSSHLQFAEWKKTSMTQRFLSVSLGIAVSTSPTTALANQQFVPTPITTHTHAASYVAVPPTSPSHHATTSTLSTTFNHGAIPTTNHQAKPLTVASPAPITPSTLNLSSASQNINLSALGGFNQLTINVGGKSEVVNVASKLTGAEAIAVAQIANGEKQTLTIDASGKAVGGAFNVDNKVLASIDQMLGGSIASLVIPKHVTVDDSVSQFTVTGGLVNNGHIVALINGSTASEIIKADSIYNAGTISAIKSIIIDSPQITNTGSITSTTKNVYFAGNQDISLNNFGGTIHAQHGDINFRDASFSGSSNVNVSGGNLLSQNLNVFTGTGTATINAPNISGAINGVAGTAHVNSHTANLKLGNLQVSGDPTYYNQGNITITNNIAVGAGQDLAIVASGNITANGGGLNTSSSTGNGGNIFISAGDPFTTSDSSSSGSGNTTTTLTLQNITSSNQTTGGFIDLTGTGKEQVPVSTFTTASTNGTGGNVTLLAFGGTSPNSGTIKIPTNLTINTSSSDGVGGNVTMYAGGASASGINIGSIYANGGGVNTSSNAQNAGGTVDIETGNPQVASGNITVTNGTTNLAVMHPVGTNNTVTLTNTGGATTATSTISAQNISSAGGNVDVLGQSTITLGNVNTSGAGGLPTTSTAAANQTNGASAGSVIIATQSSLATSGSVTVGNISAYGGGGAGGSTVSPTSGNNGGAGGNGNTVTILSLGKLTLANINTSGGGGGGGAAGSLGGAGGTAGSINLEGITGVSSTGVIASVSGGSGGNSSTSGGGGGGGASYGAGGGGGAGVTLDGNDASAGGSGGGGAFGGGGGASGLNSLQTGGAGGGFYGGGNGGKSVIFNSANSGNSGTVNTGGLGNGGYVGNVNQNPTLGGQGAGAGGAGGASNGGSTGNAGTSVTPKSGNFAGGNLSLNQLDTTEAIQQISNGLAHSIGSAASPLNTIIGGQFAVAAENVYINQGGAFNLSTATTTPLQAGIFGNLLISAYGDINISNSIGNTLTKSIDFITQAGSGGNINITGALTSENFVPGNINLMADGSITATGKISSEIITMIATHGIIEADQVYAPFFGGIAGGQQLTLKNFDDNAQLIAFGTGPNGTSSVTFNGINGSVGAGAFNAPTSVGTLAAFNPSLPDDTHSTGEQITLSFNANGTLGTSILLGVVEATVFPTHPASAALFGTTGAQSVSISGSGTINGNTSTSVLNATTINLNGSSSAATSFGTSIAPLNVQTIALDLTGGAGGTDYYLSNTGVAPLTVNAVGANSISLNTSASTTTLNGVNANSSVRVVATQPASSLLIGQNGVTSALIYLTAPNGLANDTSATGTLSAVTITLSTTFADIGTIASPINIADQTLAVSAGIRNVFFSSSNNGASMVSGGANTFNYQGTTDLFTSNSSIGAANIVLNVGSFNGLNVGTGKGSVSITTNGATGDLSAYAINGTSVSLTTLGADANISVAANTPQLTFSSQGNVDINLTGTNATTISSTGTVNPAQSHVNVTARAGLTILTNTSVEAGEDLTLTAGAPIQNSGTLSAGQQITLVSTIFNNGSAAKGFGPIGTISAPNVSITLTGAGTFNNYVGSSISATNSFDFGSATQTSDVFNDTGSISTGTATIFTPVFTVGTSLSSTSLSVSNTNGSLTVTGAGTIGTPNILSFNATGALTLAAITNSALNLSSGTESASSITLNSGGSLTTPSGVIIAAPNNADGGTISINASTWNYGAKGSHIDLVAAESQFNSTNGGSIKLHLTGTQNLAFGTGTGLSNEIVAGDNTGSGGTISVSTGGTINAEYASLQLGGSGQASGSLSLVAGGTLLLDLANSNLNLTGSALSGSLMLGSGSTTPFIIGAAPGATINGVTSTTPGIQSGGITISSPNITIAKNETLTAFSSMQLNAAVLINDGSISAAGASTLNIANPTGALTINTGKGQTGFFTAPNGVNLASVGNLTIDPLSNNFASLFTGTASFSAVASNGILNFGSAGSPITIVVAPNNVTGAGGNISIAAASLTGFTSLAFDAEGGSGTAPSGGNISLKLTGVNTLQISPTTYSFNNSVADSSNPAGSIFISSGGNLFVNNAGVITSGVNPNVSLIAGSVGAGVLNINNLQAVANQATGNSMNLTLASNSTAPFNFAGADPKGGNGVLGSDSLTVNNLTVTNTGGSISNGPLGSQATISANAVVLQATASGVIGTVASKGVAANPFTLTANTLTVLTSTAGSANIQDNSDGEVTLISASTGRAFNFIGGGILDALGPINAASLGLNGMMGSNPVNTNASSITANVGSSSLTINDTTTAIVTLNNVTAGSFTLNAAGSIATDAAATISAPVISINAGGATGSISIGQGVVGQLNGTVNLSASGKGTISDASIFSAPVTALNLSLNAATGAIGTAGLSFSTSAYNTVLSTQGATYINNSIGSDDALATFTAGSVISRIGALSLTESFTQFVLGDVYSTGGIAVNSSASTTQLISGANVNTQSGNISLLSSGMASQLQIANGANVQTGNGNITLQSTSVLGTIVLSGNNNITAFSPTVGSGNVTLAIGKLPPRGGVAGNAPSFVTPVITAPGKIFYGQPGIISGAGINTLNANGATILFNNSSTTPAAGSIQLGGGITITADPPAPVVNPVANFSSPHLQTPEVPRLNYANYPAPSNSAITLPASIIETQTSSSLTSGTSTSGVAPLAVHTASGDLRNDISLQVIPNLSAYATDAIAVETSNASSAFTSNSSVAMTQAHSLTGGVLKRVAMRSNDGMQITTTAVQELQNGAALLSPKELSTIKTPFGVVKLMPRTLALLIVNENGLSIFNLNENRAASISVDNGGLSTNVCVGQSLHISPARVANFEDLNPITYVGYRNVSKKLLAQDLTVFRAEYSIPTLMGGLEPLRDMLSSQDRERRAVANNLLKTVALMSQMGQQSKPYELMQPASLAAMANR